jgi:hypothetical protein
VGKGSLRLAFWVVVFATPVASWWLIGDQSEGRDPYYLDYVARAPNIPSWIVGTAGAVAALLLLVSVAAMARAVEQRQMDRRWFGVLALLVFAGAIVAYAGRIATAGVHGANIGFGLCVIFGGPTLVVVALAAIALSVSIRRTSTPAA